MKSANEVQLHSTIIHFPFCMMKRNIPYSYLLFFKLIYELYHIPVHFEYLTKVGVPGKNMSLDTFTLSNTELSAYHAGKHLGKQL